MDSVELAQLEEQWAREEDEREAAEHKERELQELARQARYMVRARAPRCVFRTVRPQPRRSVVQDFFHSAASPQDILSYKWGDGEGGAPPTGRLRPTASVPYVQWLCCCCPPWPAGR